MDHKYSRLTKYVQKINPNLRMPRIFMDSVDWHDKVKVTLDSKGRLFKADSELLLLVSCTSPIITDNHRTTRCINKQIPSLTKKSYLILLHKHIFFSHFMLVVNSSTNMIIYSIFNSTFRAQFLSLLRYV